MEIMGAGGKYAGCISEGSVSSVRGSGRSKQETATIEDVPDFYNLREVVSKFIEEDGLWNV
ncbi:hypothetical protein P7H06_15675 [Paenibacillus larvae]|nr:hypothetical protein [Paenibacillus larvae]MDT2260660.1 hypothetical protein [Paenibacillus larvae]